MFFSSTFAQSNKESEFKYIGAQKNMISNRVSWKQVRDDVSGPLIDLQYTYQNENGDEEILDLRDHPAFNYFSQPQYFIPEARRMMDHIYLLLDNVYSPDKKVYHTEDRTLVRKKIYAHTGMLSHFLKLSCQDLADNSDAYLEKLRTQYNEAEPSLLKSLGMSLGLTKPWEDNGQKIFELRIKQCNEGFGNIALIYKKLSEILQYQLDNHE